MSMSERSSKACSRRSGVRSSYSTSTRCVCAPRGVDRFEIPAEICLRNRISILAAGPLLHRFRRARLHSGLGGDKIGKRPVDFHLKGLSEMGAEVTLDGNCYDLSVGPQGLHGAHIVLPFPSVMATENLLIAAVLARGRTIIENAAIEPEILELVKMLQKMGADIMMNSHRTYVILGVERLHGCELRCMPDRNQAVSFAGRCAGHGRGRADRSPCDMIPCTASSTSSSAWALNSVSTPKGCSCRRRKASGCARATSKSKCIRGS